MYSSKKLSMTLLPKVPGLQLENLAIDAKTVLLSVASTSPSASCPVCGQKTARLHSHYRRTATDLRRAPGFRSRALRPQDDAPARSPAAGWLRTGRRGRRSAAMAPRHECEPLYPSALRAELAERPTSTTPCRRDRRLGFPARPPLRHHHRRSDRKSTRLNS